MIPLVLAIVFLLQVSPAEAQLPPARSISGVVVEAGSRAPIPNAGLSVGQARATTDAAGRFTLAVPAGRITVVVTADGYFALTTGLDVPETGLSGAELALARDEGFTTAIAVTAPRPAAAPATAVVEPLAVLRTPGALDNVFRTLQSLPGVAATDEFGSRLAVRGGSPDQNLTVMDGVEIHDPYRLFGLTSAFNPEIIERFELATGGFSVRHGDRLSSLLVVENRDGTRAKALAGSAALSITDANLVLEGRLPGRAEGSWLVTGRRTYYDLVAARITDQQFPAFTDLQAKGVWDAGPGRTLTVFGLRSRQDAAITIDEDDARGEFQDDTENDLAWARFDLSLGASVQSHTVAGYSDTRST
ncbi:MAG: TonB-dependent receptor, partial [Legionella sp.]|nr:TonB-dependent receptor [Legionella sp.]